MYDPSPFKPAGNTFALMASTPASPAQMASGPVSGNMTYLIYNQSSVADAFVSFGQSSGAAVSRAVVPLVGGVTSAAVLVVARGTAQTFTLPPRQFFSAVTQFGQAVVYITPGYGA